MTRDEQIQFVKEHAKNLMKEMIEDIEKGKIQEEWDGIELQWLFAERSATHFGQTQKKRKKEFNNTVLVNNL